jgi:MinD superfamily P-loop ATPase
VRSSLGDVDLVLLVVEAGRFGSDDQQVVALLPEGVPAILVANKPTWRIAAPTCCPGCRVCRSAMPSPSTCRCRRSAAPT